MPRLTGLAVLDTERDEVELEPRHKPVAPRPKIVRRVDAVRIEGSIRKIRQDRGFSFLAGDDGVDHFFHWSGMEKTSKNFRDLEVQDRVSFISIDGDKGPRAICIRVEE
jgi:cold shock CspA family protein